MALPLAAFAYPAAPAAAASVYPLEPIPGLEYVAVAPRAFADHLAPLVAWKTVKGVPAQVFELEQILSSYPGRDDAERLHNFLHDLYYNPTLNKSPKWLLLVGDGDWDRPIIPLREVYTNSQQDGDLNNSQNWYTTDTYYGNLESNWDENGNGIFGEFNEGDWTPELYVGRVPVDNTVQLDRWVARQLTYEQNPQVGQWMRQAILAGALASAFLGGSVGFSQGYAYALGDTAGRAATLTVALRSIRGGNTGEGVALLESDLDSLIIAHWATNRADPPLLSWLVRVFLMIQRSSGSSSLPLRATV